MSKVTQIYDATNGLTKTNYTIHNTAGRLEECTARRIGVGYSSTTEKTADERELSSHCEERPAHTDSATKTTQQRRRNRQLRAAPLLMATTSR